MPILKLQVYESLRAVSDLPITRLVSPTAKGCDTYRPVFWYTDADKKVYEENFDIQHSRCYTEYGLKRTGCVDCPFNKHINEELEIIKVNEPELYKAAVNIFGKSYEYTRKYREFVKMMKAKEKEEKKHDELLINT